MLITYKIEGRRYDEKLPAITLSSSHGMASVVDAYERRAGKLTSITVELVDDSATTRKRLGESA